MKNYLKPEVELVKFYSEEEIADMGGQLPGSEIGEGTGSDNWID